jgi:hypothetical protein
MLHRFRAPSPGLVVATIAVFLLGAAGATAAAKINGKNIKKGTIQMSSLAKSVQTAIKATGPAGPAGAPGAQGPAGPAGAPAARYWAVVLAGGAVARSSGGVTANKETNNNTTVHYDVRFPVDVSQCSYQVTGGEADGINNNTNVFARVAAVAPKTGSPNTVVAMLYSFASDFDPVEDNFHIAVFC